MSKRILVVEDQPDNRQIIRDMLAPTDMKPSPWRRVVKTKRAEKNRLSKHWVAWGH